MKKRIGLMLALVAMLIAILATPAQASLDIIGIYYNFDAGDNEDALYVDFTQRPDKHIKGGEFQLQKKETTIAEVEARIFSEIDEIISDLIKLTTIEAEDPVRQDPPELVAGEKIVIINNSEYLETHICYFAIHIYSLDNPDTPESELRFITRFQDSRAGEIPDNWWQ